ncbi:MAG: hypothetical protein KatS3mg009_0371 [Acidimicrobiia bacterium]|nr:MAG: hypothetical protein KatS3mg009_0371 [Acidimicrobiia bacterium]
MEEQTTMSTRARGRRLAATAGVLALAVVLSACRYTGWNDGPAKTAGNDAVDWIVTQQQNDGGFEVAGFPGFETPDAVLAIAEDAQQQWSWSKPQALAAVQAVTKNGNDPLDYLDDFAEGGINAGQAAKLIVLVTAPLGLSATAFDPEGDGATNLVAIVDAGAQPNGSYGAFNATLYAAMAKRLVSGSVPANTLAYIRAAQEASGGFDYLGDPNGNDADVDTTAAAIQALAAANVPGTDADLRDALEFLAYAQQSNGAWQAFGSDDPNSTAMAMLGITAAGFDPNASCWRDVVAPSLAGDPYAKPSDWLRTRQLPSGRVQSPNDGFGINTFATSQAVEAWRRGWIPVTPIAPQTCP